MDSDFIETTKRQRKILQSYDDAMAIALDLRRQRITPERAADKFQEVSKNLRQID